LQHRISTAIGRNSTVVLQLEWIYKEARVVKMQTPGGGRRSASALAGEDPAKILFGRLLEHLNSQIPAR